MIHEDFDSLIKQISESSNKSSEEIQKLIQEKIKELQDLISKEGAAHIVANELGVKLFQQSASPTEFKIKEIPLGHNAVNLVGKVTNVFEIRSFKTEKREGRVASLMIGDETGKLRITIWDEKIIDKFPQIKDGDILKINKGYSKENNGFKEVHLGSKSQLLINPEGINVEIKENNFTDSITTFEKLNVETFGTVFATIVNVYEPKSYEACPQCNKKVFNNQCMIHGLVEAKQVPLISLVIDDGTQSLRATCFRDTAEQIINNEVLFENIKKNLLGKQMLFRGRKKINEMYNTEDFNIATVTEINPKEFINQYVS